VIIAILTLALGVAAPEPQSDSVPRVTLAEALERAVRLNPDYVQALGSVSEAEWARTAARVAFFVPAMAVELDGSKYSHPFFNIGTGQLATTAVTFQMAGRYDVFTAQKFTDLARTSAELESANASELQRRYGAALLTESAYYAVLATAALNRVASDRLDRAGEQLAVARARVVSGAAVQTDSLQIRLEVTRSRVALRQTETALEVARLELGRRIGLTGPADAVPLDTLPAPELPISLPEAVSRALEQGPEYRVARANERAANAALKGRRGAYLPTVFLAGNYSRYDTKYFPGGFSVAGATLGISLPIWNNGVRELAIKQARTDHDVAQAVRSDLERAAARDVTEAYEGYETARYNTDLAKDAVVVATENYRVQDVRYRAGATTILDLLVAQNALSDAEAGLVQARYNNLLALAGLESILGERLFPDRLGEGQ
jgi:outer membrane protein TolC